MATNSLTVGTGFEPLSGDVWGGIDPTTGLPYRTDQGVPQTGFEPFTGPGVITQGAGGGSAPAPGGTSNPIVQDPVTGMPIGTDPFMGGGAPPIGPIDSTGGTGGPLIGSINPTGGTSGGGVIRDDDGNIIGGTVEGVQFPIGTSDGPLIGSIDRARGTSGDFDLETLEGIDQAIAQLESQIDTGRSGAVPDYSAFFQSPGYQFRQDEGIRAIDRSASARGQLMSGGTLRELQRYGQGLASSEFNNYANRLAGLAGVGQTAAFGGGQLGAQAAGQVGQASANIGQTIMAGGTAQASGIIGANNAWQQGIGGAAGQFGSAVQQFGAGQGWWGGYDPNTGINWNTGRF